jgi:hypothetical protein
MPVAARLSTPEPPPPPEGKPASQILPAQARTDARTIRNKVLTYIRACGDGGSTCEQVELALKLSHQTASARIKELRDHPVHGGRIQIQVVEGKKIKRPTISGRSAYVYVINKQLAELP